MKDIDIQQLWASTQEWVGEFLWSPDTIYQLALIGATFIFSWLLGRIVRRHAENFIESHPPPLHLRGAVRNTMRLIWPAFALAILFVSSLVTGAAMELEQGLLLSIQKLLLAWIVIRTLAQLIGNRFVRNVFAVTIWIIAALSIFNVLDETMAALDAAGFSIGDFRLSALIVLQGLFSVFLLLYVAIFFSGFAERRILKISGLTRSSQVLIAKITRVSLIVIALLIGITSAGVDLSLFAVFGGAIGLGVGFGLQKGISNLFSGMLLLMDRSIKPGDVIEMEGGTFGWVNNMAARYTEIVTRDNKSFLIPNEEFITQRVVNWSHGDTLIRLEVEFGVSYEHNPHEVKELAETCITKSHDRICEDPEPVCHLVEFADSSLNFKLRFWIKDAEKGVTNIRGAVMLALWDAFEKNNINIPYPHREVYIHEPKAKKKK